LPAIFLTLRIQRDIILNAGPHISSCNVPVIRVRFYWNLNFRDIIKYKISWKSVQQAPRYLMWTGGRTDTTKIIVSCLDFRNAPKNFISFTMRPKITPLL
jgi:hypothetical protein